MRKAEVISFLGASGETESITIRTGILGYLLTFALVLFFAMLFVLDLHRTMAIAIVMTIAFVVDHYALGYYRLAS